ncbi:50S ribosomal protein L35 [Pseudovibrio sp. Ad13]|nr:50S ribosomal protein L35 [Pseudovibrio sp. Ad13]KZK93804.1 50S ribosomal protein L35 [Pseudovibrio sp. Ad46]KZL00018.1 50S ribosomal protein L35 [Pseudovibrio sp. Ad5]KZL15605.1 50S ribosomal protein L35 [Pseudovibrio sp. Ad26]KZL28140.1 50S ribosomal protein L35 [Pseudovibrio sp. Ad37]
MHPLQIFDQFTDHHKKGRKMPKLKTKSGAKKRFKLTATGKVKCGQAGKRHGMIKRTTKFIRNARGTTTLCDADARIVKKYLPYG